MITTVLFLYLLPMLLSGNIGASNWLLESSFQAKPINMISDQVSSIASSVVNVTCKEQLDAMLNQRPFSTSWPMQMLDSNAQLPPGVMQQAFTSVGSYRQCLQIHSQHQNTPVDGQFCFLTFSLSNATELEASYPEKNWIKETVRLNNRFRYALGICIPDACSKKDLTLLFANSPTAKKADLKNVQVELCQTDKPQPLTEKLQEYNNNIAFPVLVLILVAAFLGTFFGHKLHWLECFSVIKSTKSIFIAPKLVEGTLEYRLRFFHGIRFWAMSWLFFAHAAGFNPPISSMPISYVSRHPFDILSFIGEWPIVSSVLFKGFYAVETFFFLSGFLLTTLIIDKNAAKKISFLSFVARRWIRFVVPLMGAIILMKVLFMLWKGPFFTSEVTTDIYSACNDGELWKNLLFITNFTETACYRVSWFLSVDLQIHIVAFVLVLALRRSSYRWVYGLSNVLASLSFVIPLILLLRGLPTVDITLFFEEYNFETSLSPELRWLFYAPYMHFGAYFFGAILGTLLMTNDKLLARFHKPIFWASIIGMLVAAFHVEPSFESLGNSHLIRGMFIGTGLGLWNLSLGMIVFQLALPEVPGHAKWLSRFLTHPSLRPISKLSFSIYLTQITVMILNFGLVDDVHHISLQSSLTFSFSCLVQTLVLSWIHFVLFESPSHHLVKALTSPKNEKEAPVGSRNAVEDKASNSEQEMLNIEPILINNNKHATA